MYQYLFYDYHLVYILATVWDTSTSISDFTVFQHTVHHLLKLILATQSKLLLESNYLKLTAEGLSFHAPFVPNAINSHAAVDWKDQRCKCTMVYLKNSFIVSLFLFLIIHNIALLQGLVAVTTGVMVKNSSVKKCLLLSLPKTSSPDIYPCLVWIVWRSTWSSSSDNGVSLDLIVVSLLTSGVIFAVRTRKSLCRMYRKPPFLQLLLCWISNLLQQGQDVGRLYVFPTISESYWIPESLFRLLESKFCVWK